MTTEKTPVEVEATLELLMYYERFRIEGESLSDFVNRIMFEHDRELSRSKSRAKFESALGVMLILSLGAIYILEFFKFDDNIALWVSLLIGAVGAILYYFKSFIGRFDDK